MSPGMWRRGKISGTDNGRGGAQAAQSISGKQCVEPVEG